MPLYCLYTEAANMFLTTTFTNLHSLVKRVPSKVSSWFVSAPQS